MSLPVVVVASAGTHAATAALTHLAQQGSGGRIVALVPPGTSGVETDPSVRLMETAAEPLRLGKGCGCCTVRGDLRGAIRDLADRGEADQVVIHTGPGDDLSMVAKTFSVADDSGFTLAQSATLQGLVAVVSVGELLAAPQTVREAVERIELATVVLMDSTGADDPARQRAERIVAALNPDAHLVWSGDDTAAGADGDPHTTAPFDLDAAQDRAALQDLLYGDGAGETEHVQRFAFRARRPFHPGRLQRWLSAGWPGLVRVRGQFWVCTAPHVAADMDIALGDAKTTMGGHWWAAVPEDNRPSEPAFVAYLQQVWDPTFGDRRQELAFVGTGVNPTTLLRSLEGCLLTQDELTTPGLWENEPHPFPWPDGGV